MFPNLARINKTLHSFSGEDVHIIEELNHPKVNRNFNIIGFLVAVICVLCLVSSGIFIFNILDGATKLFTVPIALFWGFAVTNIYILLLYTISPPLLFDKSMIRKKNRKNASQKFIKIENFKRFWEWLTFSMILRLGFILVFAIIIAQPLNVFVFGHKIKKDLDVYKMSFKSNMILTSDSMRIADEMKYYTDFHNSLKSINISKKDSATLVKKTYALDAKALADAQYLKNAQNIKKELYSIKKNPLADNSSLVSAFDKLTEDQIESDRKYLEENNDISFSDSTIQKQFNNYINNLKRIIEQKNEVNEKTEKIIESSNFYLRKILLVNDKVTYSAVFNILSIVIFVFPIYLKFQVRRIRIKDKISFYAYKQAYETRVVADGYKAFKERFSSVLRNRYSEHHARVLRTLDFDFGRLKKIKPEVAANIEKDIEKRFSYQPDFYEKYLDPPFNLKDKEKNIRERSEKDFLKNIKVGYSIKEND